MKLFKLKYRIIEANKQFYPQKKSFFGFWKSFNRLSTKLEEPLFVAVQFDTLQAAQNFIDFVHGVDNPQIYQYDPTLAIAIKQSKEERL